MYHWLNSDKRLPRKVSDDLWKCKWSQSVVDVFENRDEHSLSPLLLIEAEQVIQLLWRVHTDLMKILTLDFFFGRRSDNARRVLHCDRDSRCRFLLMKSVNIRFRQSETSFSIIRISDSEFFREQTYAFVASQKVSGLVSKTQMISNGAQESCLVIFRKDLKFKETWLVLPKNLGIRFSIRERAHWTVVSLRGAISESAMRWINQNRIWRLLVDQN